MKDIRKLNTSIDGSSIYECERERESKREMRTELILCTKSTHIRLHNYLHSTLFETRLAPRGSVPRYGWSQRRRSCIYANQNDRSREKSLYLLLHACLSGFGPINHSSDCAHVLVRKHKRPFFSRVWHVSSLPLLCGPTYIK